MLPLYRLALFFLFLTIAESAFPQVPDFHFQNITTANGLSSNEITCIYQDHDGFLWIGTHFGLNRYDGNQVQTFYHDNENPNSLSGNDIVDILEDQQNIFWIATKDGGLTRYDPSQLLSNQFRQFKNNPSDKNSIATNRLTCLFDYSNEYLLVGAEVCTGFFVNKKTFQIGYIGLQFLTDVFIDPAHTIGAPSVANNWIHHVYREDSFLYVSFLIGGYVYRLNEHQHTYTIPAKGGEGSRAYSIPSFVIDRNTAWLSAWSNGLFLQEDFLTDTTEIPVQKKILDIDDQILCVASLNKDYMLAGSKSTGLYIVNKNDFSSRNFRHDRSDNYSIASNKINCIFRDRGGILWIGTSDGISKYNTLQWQFHAQPLSANDETEITHYSIHEDEIGTLRVCTSEGLFEKSPGDQSFHLHQFTFQNAPLSPTCIFKSSNGNFYMCTERNFLSYNPRNETIDTIFVDEYAGKKISSIYDFTFQFRSVMEDTIYGHPFFVLGILGDGLAFYDLSTFNYYYMVNVSDQPKTISDNLIHVVTKDHAGNIWVGTANGLCKWNHSYPPQNDFISYSNVPGNDSTISGNNITGIIADAQNHLWITTDGNGLNEFDGKTFHHYLTSETPGNNMFGIYADDSNRFWIPSAKGFDVFERETKTFDEVVVPNPEWILQYPARMLKKSDGTFCYGAGNNLVTFNPDSFQFESEQPKVYLTDFKVMDKSIFQTASFNDLKFPYDQNFFAINFSALQLSQRSPVRYFYQLKGLNDRWVGAGVDGRASFTSLPPGNYALNVRVINDTGHWSEATQLISFCIEKPFWMQWWFALICAAIALLIVYIIFQIRLRQLIRLQEIRQRIATDLHDDIGSALSSISISSQLAKKFSEQDDEKVDRILNRINTTSRETMDSMSDIVWAINPKNDSGKNMILKMQRVSVDLLESKGIQVHFDCDENFEKMRLGMEGRKNLFLIFKEAVNNIS
ncbi:MAG: two-component regulator propeller domain-containing protein, partial [Chitinophagales bacterium]